MALEGTIKEFGLADIFQLLGLQKKTGVLFLKDTDCTVNIHFEDGMVVKAEESRKSPRYLTGNIFINRGKINKEQLAEALEIQKSTAQKLGNIFIGQGLINKDELRDALSFQMKEAVYKVFRWKGGDYKFYQDKVEYDRDTVVPLSSEHLLMDGIRMLDEWPMIEKKLPEYDVVLRRGEKRSAPDDEREEKEDIFGGFDEAGGGISKEAGQILKLVDGSRSIYEVVEFSPLGEFDTCKALTELLDRGYLIKTGARPGIMLENIESPLQAIKPPVRVRLDRLPYVFVAAALVLIFLQITGARKIMNPRESRFEELKSSFTLGQVARVRDNLELYCLEYGSYPQRLSMLSQLDYISDGDTLDAWGSPLKFVAGPDGGGPVTSLGPDKEPGTADDIASIPY